jgi:hypothetical protein
LFIIARNKFISIENRKEDLIDQYIDFKFDVYRDHFEYQWRQILFTTLSLMNHCEKLKSNRGTKALSWKELSKQPLKILQSQQQSKKKETTVVK